MKDVPLGLKILSGIHFIFAGFCLVSLIPIINLAVNSDIEYPFTSIILSAAAAIIYYAASGVGFIKASKILGFILTHIYFLLGFIVSIPVMYFAYGEITSPVGWLMLSSFIYPFTLLLLLNLKYKNYFFKQIKNRNPV